VWADPPQQGRQRLRPISGRAPRARHPSQVFRGRSGSSGRGRPVPPSPRGARAGGLCG
jgi:hypothetical protein